MRLSILSLLILSLLASCSEEKQEDKSKEESTEVISESSEELVEEAVEEASEEELPAFVGSWKVETMLFGDDKIPVDFKTLNASFRFNTDKTFEKINVESEDLQGTWSYNKKEAFIDMNFPTSKEEYHIEEISDERLVLLQKSVDGGLRKEFILSAIAIQ